MNHSLTSRYGSSYNNAVDFDLGKNATVERLKNFLGHLGNNFEQQAIKNSYFQSMPPLHSVAWSWKRCHQNEIFTDSK